MSTRPHLFTYRDIARISKVVDPTSAPGTGVVEASQVASAIASLQADLLVAMIGASALQLAAPWVVKLMQETASWMLTMMRRVPSQAEEVIRTILTDVIGEPAEEKPQAAGGDEEATSNGENDSAG